MTDASDAPAASRRRLRIPAPVDAGTPERRPADLAVVVVALVGVVLTGMWAQTGSNIDTSFFSVVNGLPNAFEGIAELLSFLGSLWFVGIVVVFLLLARWLPAARDVAVAAGAPGCWHVASTHCSGTRAVAGLDVVVRTGDGPAFPVASVAAFTALTVALVAVSHPPDPSPPARHHPLRRARVDVPRHRVRLRRRGRAVARAGRGCVGAPRVRRAGRATVGRPDPRRAHRAGHRHDLGDPVDGGHRARHGDGGGAGVRGPGTGRGLRARPTRRPGRGATLARSDVPRAGRSDLRESTATGRARRVRAPPR